MKTLHFLPRPLFYGFLAVSGFYALAFLYTLVALITETDSLIFLDQEQYTIFYPFTENRFLMGKNELGYKISMLMTLSLYSFFFLLLAGIFQALSQKKLFASSVVKSLKRFAQANLLAPVACFLTLSILLSQEIEEEAFLYFFHLLIGIVSLGITWVFKRGTWLQNEQDLTI